MMTMLIKTLAAVAADTVLATSAFAQGARQVRRPSPLTNTAISAARFYWELHFSLYNAADVSIPAAVSVFPGENYQAPRSWAERAYHKLIYYNQVDTGGHYAAWEQPQLFSEEVRAGFRPLRKSI
jgi:hypothetical protein